MTSDTPSGCPVVHKDDDGSNKSQSTNTTSSAWRRWLGGSSSSPADDSSLSSASGCPVKPSNSGSTVIIPASVEEAARHAQTPHPDQAVPLSTHRAVSSIPRADDELRKDGNKAEAASSVPHHQPSAAADAYSDNNQKWVYPSEQQFYNAMRRKGWQAVDETTIPLVVRIHNAVNEKGWTEVLKWERLRGNTHPRLVRFMGRPNDVSPKAWINTHVWGYRPPFDRHDWYVVDAGGNNNDNDENENKQPRRYVIDFYNGEDGSSIMTEERGGGILSTVRQMMGKEEPPSPAAAQEMAPPPSRPPAMYLDVRPALDTPDAAVDRARMFVRDAFPGLVAAFGKSRNSRPSLHDDDDKDNPSMHPQAAVSAQGGSSKQETTDDK